MRILNVSFVFFFSGRRRHTRSLRDWSSDVCSSDLGEDTLTDTKVRRTWQIGSERVRIGGRHWPGTLQTILLRAAEGLGVSGPVDAEFYKLLVYDQGSFCTRAREG